MSNNNQPQVQQVNVTPLGDSEYGMIGGGLVFRQDAESGMMFIAVALTGGKMSTLAPMQAMQIELRVVGALPITSVVEAFANAETQRVANAALLIPTLSQ